MLWTLGKEALMEIIMDIQRDPDDVKDPKHVMALTSAAAVVRRVNEVAQRNHLMVCNFPSCFILSFLFWFFFFFSNIYLASGC